MRGDEPVTGLETRKVEALLIYLASNRRAHPREVLAELLWEERSQQQAQSNLRAALTNLRQILGEYVTIDRDTAALNPQADVWFDAAELEKGLSGWRAGRGALTSQAAEQVEAAVDLYQGEFLEGFSLRESPGFEAWMVRERERLHRMVVDALHDLVEYELQSGAGQAGLVHASRLLELDPLMEAAHTQMMVLLTHSGRRNDALAQYETLKRLLWDELGVTPSDATEALNRKIRAGKLEPIGSNRQGFTSPESVATKLPNPYKGLRAFTEADAEDFFGREALIERLLARLGEGGEASRFLAVVGPSGCGKSSVVKAGLIPALRRGELPGSESWCIVEILPGAHPLEELEIGLLRLAGDGKVNLDEQLRRDERGLLRAARLALPGETDELVLVIDQFEELFTLVDDRAVVQHFLDNLYAAVADPHSRIRVVITLRADLYDRPLAYPDLGRLIQKWTEVVLPLTPEELELAIRSPAERLGVSFEPGLVTKVVAEVVDQPGGLPLLQYYLTELFERREGRLLTSRAYQAIGGMAGALNRRAEEIYTGLDQAGQAATRQLFLRLVTLGEGTEETRRRVRRSELEAVHLELAGGGGVSKDRGQDNGGGLTLPGGEPVQEAATVMDSVIDTFGGYRLLSFDRDPATREPTVEIAHEALLREWRRLWAWLEESREDLRKHRQFGLMATEWEQAGREASFLLRGTRLGLFENWAAGTSLALTPTERTYLETSLAERQARQQQELEAAQRLAEAERQRAEAQTRLAHQLRRWTWLLAGALLIAVVLAVVALGFAQRAQHQARVIASRELTADAIENLEVDPERSMLLAIRAISEADTLEAEDALHRAIQASRLRLTLSGHAGSVIKVAYNTDGTRLATVGSDGVLKVWDTATGQELFTRPGKTGFVDSAAFSPDGKRLAEAYFDGSVDVWDIPSNINTGADSRKALLTLPGQTNQIHSILELAFSPDGRHLVTAGKGVTVWDAASGRPLLDLGADTDLINAVAFSPDGKRLASVKDNGGISVWDFATGQELLTLPGGSARVLAFSPDGKRLVTGNSDGSARVLDASSGKESLSLIGHKGSLFDVAFSPDGTRLATASEDRTAKIWDAFTGEALFTLSSHTDFIYDLAFSPDGDGLATASADGTARLWDISPAGSREMFTLSGLGPFFSGVFLPDGALLVPTIEDGTTKILDISPALNAGTSSSLNSDVATATSQELVTLSGQVGDDLQATFSPDGKRLATFSKFETIRIWDVSTGKVLKELFAIPIPNNYQVASVIFSPDGTRLATTGWFGGTKIWDTVSGQELLTLPGYAAIDTAFSMDGKRLATADLDGKAYIWDAASGQKLLTLAGHRAGLNKVAFSPDGTRLATADNGGVIKVWDAKSGVELFTLPGQPTDLYGYLGLAFSPDGRRLATTSNDGTVKIWDADSGQKLLTLGNHPGRDFWVTFSPDGRYLASVGSDGTLRVYAMQVGDLVTLAKSRLTRSWTTEECQQYLHVEQCPPPP